MKLMPNRNIILRTKDQRKKVLVNNKRLTDLEWLTINYQLLMEITGTFGATVVLMINTINGSCFFD